MRTFVGRRNFYGFMASQRDELFRDGDSPLCLAATMGGRVCRVGATLEDGASLYLTLAPELGSRLTVARQRITAAAATDREAKYLGVAPGAPLIFTERLARDANNRRVELAEAWSVPKLALWVELHR